MKILLLTDGIHPYVIGGMQKHSYNLACSLALAGVQVHMVHCVYEGELPEIDINAFDKQVLKNLTFSCYKFPSLGKFPGHYIRESWKYAQMIYGDFQHKWDDYDFVYAKGFTAWTLISQKQSKNISVPIGVKFHGYEMFQKPPSWKMKIANLLLKGPTKYNNQKADFVFSYGGKITQIIQNIGVKPAQVIEIPTGIAEEWLRKPQEDSKLSTSKVSPRKFVFVGRNERRKGIEELNAAIRQLKTEKLPPYEIHFIGPIPREHQLTGDHIFYHGEIRDTQKIKELLRASDILICPSHSEGMPNVILEGMASGLAVIATDVGAVALQIDGNGWLLEKPSIELLKNAIKDALLIPQYQLNELKTVSLRLVESKFLWNKIALETIGKITTAIEEYKRLS